MVYCRNKTCSLSVSLYKKCKASWAAHAFQVWPSACTSYLFKIQCIWFIAERDWKQGCCHYNNLINGCHSVPYLMYFTAAKFESHYSYVFVYILHFVFYYGRLQCLWRRQCFNKTLTSLERKKVFQMIEKHHSLHHFERSLKQAKDIFYIIGTSRRPSRQTFSTGKG